MKNQIQKILNKRELALVKKLNTPNKIQDFLDKIPFNFEEKGETYFSPRKLLQNKKAHCFEGAIFAYLCLKFHGYQSFLLDLKVQDKFMIDNKDSDHTVCIFKINKFWGAISKTNHAVLRSRDPIYKDFKEIAKTYFHEYFLDNGEKTLQSFSKPFDVFKKFGLDWVIEENHLEKVAEALDYSPHLNFVPKKNRKYIRKACNIEIKLASIEEWNKNGRVLK